MVDIGSRDFDSPARKLGHDWRSSWSVRFRRHSFRRFLFENDVLRSYVDAHGNLIAGFHGLDSGFGSSEDIDAKVASKLFASVAKPGKPIKEESEVGAADIFV